MILHSDKKIIVDGVEVFPDHSDSTRFWYVPSAIRLAERDGRKVLSYIWYIDGSDDEYGRGFLNFEVNTRVDESTLRSIKREILDQNPAIGSIDNIKLAPVTYDRGTVNFSALGPVVQGVPPTPGLQGDNVIIQDENQIVWHGGSSSLVAENAAVCSITFTKEGRLAAAMEAAIKRGADTIAANYSLSYLALRPAVTFKVTGNFTHVINRFKASLGLPIPLKAFLLDTNISRAFELSFQNTDVRIEVINYTGEASEGLEWARKILYDYVLEEFFTVRIGQGQSRPLNTDAALKSLMETAAQLWQQGKSRDDVAKGLPVPIPSVSLDVENYTGIQHNRIKFVYSEMKAFTRTISPQGFVAHGLHNPETYIMKINRAENPFGLPYPVLVAINPGSFSDYGLLASTVDAKYPAGSPPTHQLKSLRITEEGSNGPNPLPFQYNSAGDRDVQYNVEHIFKAANDDWQADEYRYKHEGLRTGTGVIDGQPEAFITFLDLKMSLDDEFVWHNIDEAVVSVTSGAWSGDKRVTFRAGQDQREPKHLKVRYDSSVLNGAAPAYRYRVELKKNGQTEHQYGPLDVSNEHIVVQDQFLGHVPVAFIGDLDEGISFATVAVTYRDPGNNHTWEPPFLTFRRTDPPEIVQLRIPTRREYDDSADCVFSYTMVSDGVRIDVPEARAPLVRITGREDTVNMK